MYLKHEKLKVVGGNILNTGTFEEFAVNKDTVISTVGTGTSFAKAYKPTTLYSDGFANIVAVMRKHKIKRFIALLSVGTIPDPNEALVHKKMIRPMLKGTYDDMRRAESFLAKCEDIDWTGIRPLRLNNKPGTGKYRTAKNILPPKGVNISRADVADLILKLMASNNYIREYVTIAD
ncbi:MAG: hypothetical protein B6D64_09105 [Bacteroidetes bacterium 4484_276]|nr:MAG: hypothetical protein B6D64_09105 [Bacteroidetes bacterium 4484_276]